MSAILKSAKEQRLERLKRARANRDKNYAQALNLAETMRTAGMSDDKAIASIILAHGLSTRDARQIWRAEKPRKKRARR
jgi:hypothetical protein